MPDATAHVVNMKMSTFSPCLELLKTFLLKCNLHAIKFTHVFFFFFTHVKYIVQGCLFLVYSQLCNHHYNLSFENFHHPKKKTYTKKPHSPLLRPLLQSQISIDLSILDVSCKWNHTIYGLLCLTSFTRHDVFKVHPYCSIYQ